MKKVLKIFYFAVLLQIFMPTILATNYMNVYLTTQGSFQSISIDEIDKITFPSADEVNVTILGVATPMAIDNVEVITFGDANITAIEEIEVETSDIEIIYYGDQLRISSTEVINQVQIYNMQGVLIQSFAPEVEIVTLEVGAYSKGVYVVAVQSGEEIVTKKIIK